MTAVSPRSAIVQTFLSSSGLECAKDEEEEEGVEDEEGESGEDDHCYWSAEEIHTWMHYLVLDTAGWDYNDRVDILAQGWPIATRCLKTTGGWKLAE